MTMEQTLIKKMEVNYCYLLFFLKIDKTMEIQIVLRSKFDPQGCGRILEKYLFYHR